MHILRGEFPIFQWGYSYMGTLESFTAAPLMLLFGKGRFALNMAPVLYSLLFTYACYLIGKYAGGRRTGLWAAAFAAFPSAYLVWTNVVARGAYTETLALGTLAAYFALRAAETGQERSCRTALIATGLVLGVSFWTHMNTVFMGATILVFWLLEQPRLVPRAIVWAGVPFLLGSAPYWYETFTTRFATMAVGHPDVPPFLERLAAMVSYRLPIILGITSDGTKTALIPYATWLILPIQAGGLLATASLAWGKADVPIRRAARLVLIFTVVMFSVYLASPFSGTNTQRYLVPLYIVLAIGPALLIHRLGGSKVRWGAALGLVLIVLHLIPTVRTATIAVPERRERYRLVRSEEQQVFKALEGLGIQAVYDDEYWDGAKFTFDAGEKIIFATPYYERRVQYVDFVNGAEKLAYVIHSPISASVFESTLKLGGARYVKTVVAGYSIIHSFQEAPGGGAEIPLVAARASANPVDAFLALDRDVSTRWTTLAPQKPGEWFEIDLGHEQEVGEVLLQPQSANETPRGLRVELSNDRLRWVTAVEANPYWGPFCWAQGKPIPLLDGWVVARFAPVAGRWLRLTQLGSDDSQPWTIAEVLVRGPGSTALQPPDPLPAFTGRLLTDAALAARTPGALRNWEGSALPRFEHLREVALIRPGDKVLLSNRDPLATTRTDARLGLVADEATPFKDYTLLGGVHLATNDLPRVNPDRWSFDPAAQTARIELDRETEMRGVVVESGENFPRGLTARTSVDGNTWSLPEQLEPRPAQAIWMYEGVFGASFRERVFLFAAPRTARFVELSAAPRHPTLPWVLQRPLVLTAPLAKK
jgi:hypothetical protein